MIDQLSGDFTRTLRSPDLWFGGLRVDVIRGSLPLEHHVMNNPDRSNFVYLLSGSFVLTLDDAARPPMVFPQGAALGFEGGRSHRWRALADPAAGAGPGRGAALLVSSVPQHLVGLRGLQDGMIVVPPDADPYARMIRGAADMLVWEHENDEARGDEAVARRCAEIIMIEFVRFARAKIVSQPAVPGGLLYDEYLLRAWSAYLADPRRRWTVVALANAAGLSRSVFAERFTKVFGAPPLHTLTMMRLEQAEQMLRDSSAPLIEIAFTVGYNSEAAFVRAFHRQYGQPPGRFRAQHGRDGRQVSARQGGTIMSGRPVN